MPAGRESPIVARHVPHIGSRSGRRARPAGDATAHRGDTVTIGPGTCGQRPAAGAHGGPPGLSTRAHASSGAHTNRAVGTGHHSRPGHQAAITIHQAQLKDHLDNKIAEQADIARPPKADGDAPSHGPWSSRAPTSSCAAGEFSSTWP